jgi:hypothetical protein
VRRTDNVKRGLKILGNELEGGGRIDVGVDRNQLRAFVNTAVNLQVQSQVKS